ncbi:hypothetical protein H0R92_05840 [Treponema sp. OMZ 840]|uniref:hypothetical protein n=1 Tax=Treponema sp. OMZ 840 TaxID=244313 RepID=UPI003D8E2081
MHIHTKKMIAPILIVFCVLVYSLFNLFAYKNNTPPIFKVAVFVILFVIAAAFIWLLIERIKEIKGGEEDDLGKY